MSDPVLSTIEDGVRTITLNRPARLNAMNAALIEGTRAAFAEANADPATRVIIFTGAGERAFCAGDDLIEHGGPADPIAVRGLIGALQDVTREIVLGRTIVIGAINGWAVGGGFEWAINCDFSLWAESARAFFPEVSWGLFVTGGVTTILPNLIGLQKAKELLILGEKQSARDLLDLGIAWRVVADDALMDEANALARRIADLPEQAVADMKRIVNRAAFADIEYALREETAATVKGATDPATLARIATFADKR